MKIKHLLLAAALALTGLAGQAQVLGALGGDTNPAHFLTLDSSNVIGGQLLFSSVPGIAAAPTDLLNGTAFLAVGPGSGLVTFFGGASAVSFDWGTPDSYNFLTVTQSDGSTTDFTMDSLGLTGYDTYVRFTAEAGKSITSFSLMSASPAFEVANFAVTPVSSDVPEPPTLALILLGLVSLGLYRRRQLKR